ncbi:CHAT domain-containing protein [Aerosakkonemataceae cyanobacterium BLCC-F50]|uniref:CHAT domain-containing protein n=1 Tax=Floridaenema flaviceps BLCC-F50 TaxID=3153642 RepID=A0ABV4XIN4_9CYAN
MSSWVCRFCSATNRNSATFCCACGVPVELKTLTATNLFLPLGTQLQQANFSVGKVLGQGNFTITYMGSDNLLRRPVVIKEFFPQGCDRHILTVQPSNSITAANYQSAKSKFLHEARVISQIQHSGIVKVYTCFEENNTGYIVTEFLRGKTLLKLVEERGFLLEKEALDYIQQVGKALAITHQANLLHLDIKPENIILTDDGCVVLIEFGTAKEYATQLMGTYLLVTLTSGYAALEQYTPHTNRGCYTDVHALAATLYDLLTGKVPISAIERAKGVELIPPHRLNPKVSRGVSDAVMRSLAIRVGERSQSVGDFLRELDGSKWEKYKSEASRLLKQAFEEYYKGQFEEALSSSQQALNIYKKLKDALGEVSALINVGEALFQLGRYNEANIYYNQSLNYLRNIPTFNDEIKVLLSKTLGCLGKINIVVGDYKKAIDFLNQELMIALEIKDRQEEVAALGNLVIAYFNLGDFGNGLDCSQHILDLARSIPDRRLEGAAFGNLGLTYYAVADYDQAIKCFEKQLEIARDIKDPYQEGNALGNLGPIYFALENFAKAIEYHSQHLVVLETIKNPLGKLGSLTNLGHIHWVLKHYVESISYYTESLSLARQLKNRKAEVAVLSGLGIAFLSQKDYRSAIQHFEDCVTIARQLKDKFDESINLNNLGLALFEFGDFTNSEKALHDCIKTCQWLRETLSRRDAEKVSIFERQTRAYLLLQEVLIAQNKTEEALEIAEQGRARAFAELLAERLSEQVATQTTETIKLVSSEPPSIKQIKQIAKAQNATIVEYSISEAYEIIELGSSRYSSLKEAGLINSGSRQFIRLTGELKIFIWLIKPTGEITFKERDIRPELDSLDSSLEDIILKARHCIGIIDEERNQAVDTRVNTTVINQSIYPELQQLYRILIEPIAESLPTDPNAHVIFIPQGSLFLVPFPALQHPKTNQHLVEQHTIVISPSIQVLNLTSQQRQRIASIHNLLLHTEDILIVGNPTMPTIPLTKISLKQLAGAEGEAKAIASLLKTQPITGAAATKVDIVQKMSKAKLIHLSTHGLLNDIRQLGVPGAIALAPSEGDNGFLTTGEILELKLNAFLIVLSCCHTGQGKITGDGVIGLSRSFITAGVPNLIVSLWSINDRSSALLMIKFYEILQKGTSVAIALSQAQRWLLNATSDELLKSMITHFCLDITHLTPTQKADLEEGLEKWRSPYHWAAFSVIGQAGSHQEKV